MLSVKMMSNRRLLLTAYVLWFLLIHSSAEDDENEPKCTNGIEKKIKIAVCNHRDISKFPTNLDPGIEGLYLSGTQIKKIDADSFRNLKSLKYLYMDHNAGAKISPDAFKPLSNLIILDLSFADVPDIYLPTTLEKLYLNRIATPISKLPISSLQDLKFLSLRNNTLDHVPDFGHALPSLEVLDLGGNKLINFQFDSLADLCSLKELNASKISVKNNCECLRFKKWTDDKNIKINPSIKCDSSKNSNQNCDVSEQSQNFLQKYKSCEDKVSHRKSLKTLTFWSTVCGIILAVIAICYSCVVLYVFCNRKDFSDSTVRAYFCCKKKTNPCEPEEGST